MIRGISLKSREHLERAAQAHNAAMNGLAEGLLERTVERWGLSVRAIDKVLKVARTVADLDGIDAIDAGHVAEALQYRHLDRGLK